VKEIILGVAAIGGVGTAAYVGLGGGGPDDFVRVTARSPQAVYNAMAGLGQSGEHVIPSPDGKHRMKMKVVKVPNQQIKIEFTINDEALISGEVLLTPEGSGTRIAAELDVDVGAIAELAEGAGAGPMPIPAFAMQDYLVDQVFAHAMDEMVDRIEQGKPLLSLAETRARWGRDDSLSRGNGVSGSGARGETVRPQLSTRPSLDPNAAARRQLQGSRPSRDD
jgi:hypothetical protein